jgi:glycosyltransferase involved in cell wall biosynthesis
MAATVRPGSTLVSVGMPIHNCEQTIAVAVRSLLNQTFENWELLLIDDGSTDQTVALARSFSDPRIHVLADKSHRGLVFRLNQAIDLSRGRYFARMDGDDVSYPERLRLQVEYLEKHPEIDLLGGGILIFGQDGEVLGTREARTSHGDICRRPWAGFYFAHPTWMGKTEWFQQHRYRFDALRCEDQDLLLRTHERSRFAALPEIVLGYREEALSVRKILTGRRSFLRSVIREAARRRRYAIALSAIVEQSVKGFVDCVAIGTGFNYRILRHRALPAGEREKKHWAKVWTEVSGLTRKSPLSPPVHSADRKMQSPGATGS